MGELAGDLVDDVHQMAQRAKAPGAGDGGLDLGIDRFGGGIGQAEAKAVEDAVPVLAYRRAQALERCQPAAPGPAEPALEQRRGGRRRSRPGLRSGATPP